MTREELAAMTDDKILAHYRHKYGDAYMPLSMAKKMQREERNNSSAGDTMSAEKPPGWAGVNSSSACRPTR